MLAYCLKGRKNTESKNPKVASTRNRRILQCAKCAMCNSKKMKVINEKEASALLSSWG